MSFGKSLLSTFLTRNTFTAGMTQSVVTIPACGMASKAKKQPRERKRTVFLIRNGVLLPPGKMPKQNKGATKLLAKSEQITVVRIRPSLVQPRNSVRDIMLRYRLRHWDEHRAANPDMKIPPEIPYDIDKQRAMWPPFNQYVKDTIILYRLAWKKYDEPSFVHVTSVKESERRTIVKGVVTFRGITSPRERVITSMRKDDWRILDPTVGHCTFDVWNNVVRANKDYFLPRPPCFDKSKKAEYELQVKARLDAVVESTKAKIL